MSTEPTVCEALVAVLAERGVKHIFGVPGGDCNLDFIDAAAKVGIEFVLTRSESPAAIMAAVSAELTGAPGVVMSTRGPGIANAMNGIAYASLDRSPILLIADAYEAEFSYIAHQRIDQVGLVEPLVKGFADLHTDDPVGELADLLDVAMAQPQGPVYLEVTGKKVRETAPLTDRVGEPGSAVSTPDSAALATARELISSAKRPAIVVGLQSRPQRAALAAQAAVEKGNWPAFPTYKAKGVVSDDDAHTLAPYVGGVGEEPALSQADLIIFYGVDPNECNPIPWRYHVPVIEITEHSFDRHFLADRVSLVGDIASTLETLTEGLGESSWQTEELGLLKKQLRAAATMATSTAISPQFIVETAERLLPRETRITVDAGAHMLPTMHLWHSSEPRQALISRGLATMGFALPAAIASSMTEPDRLAVAFIGDGGLMMNPAELGTAVQNHCRLILFVFNDASIAMIRAKQQRRGLSRIGMDYSPANFAEVAQGFGCLGIRVKSPEQLEPAIRQALVFDGPSVIDVLVDDSGYDAQLLAIRG